MKILSAQQVREADAYTIQHEPVSSVLLMERAASECAGWMVHTFGETPPPYYIFCGMGNNGGDGLVIARKLQEQGFAVQAWLVHTSGNASADNAANQPYYPELRHIHELAEFPEMEEPGIIVDALFGTGLNRPVEGWAAGVIHKINDQRHKHTVVSVDMPSGMMADSSSVQFPCVHARYTLTFEFYKLAFLLPENGERTGQVEVLKIGIHPAFTAQVQTEYHLTDPAVIHTIYRPRNAFSHKGTYGHALMIAGSYGKMGAALLATRACLKAGAGLVTAHIPRCGYEILQTAVPEAMCNTEESAHYSSHFDEPFRLHQAPDYAAIGIGPGIGTENATAKALERLLLAYRKPMVLDADALNIVGKYPALLAEIPEDSILTPHPKEFERLFGATGDHFERLELLTRKARELKLYVLLKGKYSAMACPDGAVYFNPTGNPGMATAGAGDVLTGILTGLLSQGYTPKAALLLGAWLHGLAGDLAADDLSEEALTAEDIVHYLGQAYLRTRQ
ncbi:NAD(P)H-hydrate dehydratase [Chitinophaga sp. GCM10012297]|uniref:Bifunctional NAD(P)H-hydrate repair enzyme n=1 Tax=Chitinophaga chungangae TaxID=2821488 RepID=A0ABS3Y9X6_9BACT|nr:NAD(P)H-hydrate dehydratase [Chitinophaga chungangae]MBO9151483.1 NAD(P)H-hydrate dehydratase [Chitinophaga chungangae]